MKRRSSSNSSQQKKPPTPSLILNLIQSSRFDSMPSAGSKVSILSDPFPSLPFHDMHTLSLSYNKRNYSMNTRQMPKSPRPNNEHLSTQVQKKREKKEIAGSISLGVHPAAAQNADANACMQVFEKRSHPPPLPLPSNPISIPTQPPKHTLYISFSTDRRRDRWHRGSQSALQRRRCCP